MGFLVFGNTSQCVNKKHVNQDRFGSVIVKSPSHKEILIAAVADGVTMCFRGEIASYNTIRFILNWGAEYFSNNEFDLSLVPDEFDKLIVNINQCLNYYSSSQKRKKIKEGYSSNTSCTLCCLITDGDKVVYFSVGDSAIYKLDPFITIDIFGGNEMQNKHKNSSGKLISYIGGIDDDKLSIRYIQRNFDKTSAYLLCTDGMYNNINFNPEQDEDFRRFNQRILSADSKSKGINVLEGMKEYVINKGEMDDITALVIKRI